MKLLKQHFYYLALMSLVALTSCGTEEEEEEAATVSFSSVNTIVTASCGGATCHGSGASNIVLVDNQENFDARKATIKTRLNTTNNVLIMPPINT